MISKKSKYALKALLYLAQKYNQGPVLISEMARQEGIPHKFLEVILWELKNKGILQSKKGRGGGYFLNMPPENVQVGAVLRCIDGPLALLPCVSQTAYSRCEECEDEYTCGIRMVMKEVRDRTAEILDGTTLADVNRQVQHHITGEMPLIYRI